MRLAINQGLTDCRGVTTTEYGRRAIAEALPARVRVRVRVSLGRRGVLQETKHIPKWRISCNYVLRARRQLI